MKLSACLIVRNEENNLPFCLHSLKNLADEIIVVDTGSIDRTEEIARSFGARVFRQKWADDFSRARNYSLKSARGQWLLVIDADEFVPEATAAEIKKILDNPDFPAYYLPIYSIKFRDRKQALKNYSAVGPDTIYYHLRLFQNNLGLKFEYPLHETVVPALFRKNIKAGFLSAPLGHYGFDRVRAGRARRNLSCLLKELDKKNKDFTFYYNYGKTLCSAGLEAAGLNNLKKARQSALINFASSEKTLGIDLYQIQKEISESYSRQNFNQNALTSWAQAQLICLKDRRTNWEPLYRMAEIYLKLKNPSLSKTLLKFIIKNKFSRDLSTPVAFNYDPRIYEKSLALLVKLYRREKEFKKARILHKKLLARFSGRLKISQKAGSP